MSRPQTAISRADRSGRKSFFSIAPRSTLTFQISEQAVVTTLAATVRKMGPTAKSLLPANLCCFRASGRNIVEEHAVRFLVFAPGLDRANVRLLFPPDVCAAEFFCRTLEQDDATALRQALVAACEADKDQVVGLFLGEFCLLLAVLRQRCFQ